jgi:Uma2 family endonuclease
MAEPALQPQMTLDQFMDWQDAHPEDKQEFCEGIPYAMTGARNSHVLVSLNLATALKTRLRGTPCRAYGPDVNFRLEAADALFHPDVTVSCDPADHAAADAIRRPILVVEVLSDSTAAYDLGKKFRVYRQSETLREVVFIEPDTRRLEVYRKGNDGHWVLYDFTGMADLELASLELRLPSHEIFEDLPAV